MERRHCIRYGNSPSTCGSLALMYLPGDKSNHIPSLHVPQVYYFIASATIFGWPVLISGTGGAHALLCEVWARIFGSSRYAAAYKPRMAHAQLAVQTYNGDRSVIDIDGCHRSPLHVGPMPSIESVFKITHLFYITRIHHPFLLSDNRHYTFYVWRRIFLVHPIVPYLLIPGYIVCAWAWFLRVGKTAARGYALPEVRPLTDMKFTYS